MPHKLAAGTAWRMFLLQMPRLASLRNEDNNKSHQSYALMAFIISVIVSRKQELGFYRKGFD